MPDINDAASKCISVINAYQQPSGAYPASPNFTPYEYCWIRDGSFIADAMSRAGQIESTERFFNWCAELIVKRRDRILQGGLLDTRYTYDGQETNEDWGNFQLDGYGTLLWAIKQHAIRHDRSIDQYQEAAGLIQHYLASHWHEPCFDWWEERRAVHAASLACIYAGLAAYGHPEAAAVQAEINLSEERTDSSLLICALFDATNGQTIIPVISAIEEKLVSEDGGVYRYKDDSYFGGGEWPVLTCMLGWYYLKTNRYDAARDKLNWSLSLMQPNGWIAEQSSKHLLHPDSYQEWENKWGRPANPLLWSEAMVLTLISLLSST